MECPTDTIAGLLKCSYGCGSSSVLAVVTYLHLKVTWLTPASHMTYTWQSHDSHQPVTWPTPDSHMTYTWQSHELQQMVTWSTSTYLHTFVCHLAHCTMVSQLFLITWSFCCGLNWCFSTKCWNNWQCPHRAAIKIQLAAPACREGGRSPSKRIATKPASPTVHFVFDLKKMGPDTVWGWNTYINFQHLNWTSPIRL